MKAALLPLSLVVSAACSGAAVSGSDSLTDLIARAKQANVQHDVEGEERLLREAVQRPGEARLRAEARRNLARTRWKFHHDFDEAGALLTEAAGVGVEPAKAWAGRSEMERFRRDYSAAADAARRAVERAEGPFERRLAVMALSAAVAGEAAEQRLGGRTVDSEPLLEALELQRGLVRAQPGDHDAARLLLTLAVLLDRGADALEAWRAYYFVTNATPARGLLEAPGRALHELWRGWPGESASNEQRAAVADALSESGFYLEAALAVLSGHSDALMHRPRPRELVAYARFCRRVREVSDEFYRLTSLGEGDRTLYQRQLSEAAGELWPDLDNPSSGPPSNQRTGLNAAIRGELAARFGAFGSLRNSGGFPSLHYGHLTARETRAVQQYGRTGTVTYTVVDHMVSNGFQTWAWNDTMETGGWATSGSIISVRSGLLREIVNIWNLYDSPTERAAIEEKMARDSIEDDDRARQGIVYLPGLHFRIAEQGIERVVGRFRDRGLEGTALRLAAIRELRRIQEESAIFAHEGRHAIDLTVDTSQRAPELEFTAKLSQIAFSSEPRLGMLGILGPNLGDSTPHGRANLRFVKGAIEWMKAHEDEIEGFDSSRPHQPQLDLLTDRQLIEVARSMDPLAGG